MIDPPTVVMIVPRVPVISIVSIVPNVPIVPGLLLHPPRVAGEERGGGWNHWNY
jgi:hypothetical protein